jgi:hypothetical protein
MSDESEFMAWVRDEVRRARLKFPDRDPPTMIAALARELSKAAAADYPAKAGDPAPQFGAEPGFYPLFPET